jgi:biotin carboxylase
MTQTLKGMRIDGIKTTLDFHQAILRHPEFMSGSYDCSFVEKHFNELLGR